MIKILTAQQLREADMATIARENISGLDLMERAATRCSDWIIQHAPEFNLSPESRIIIFCGVGNNGGDGLVISRKLQEKGFLADTFIVRFSTSESPEFSENLNRLQQLKGKVADIHSPADIPSTLENYSLIVDAIFGTGLSRPADGLALEVINQINKSPKPVISIDIPSGLFSDPLGDNGSPFVVRASVTLTFQHPKLSFFLPGSGEYCGEVEILDIGLDQNFIQQIDSSHYMITTPGVAAMLQFPEKFSHKGTFGHALLLSGSRGKMGAAVLAAKAGLKAGAGLVTAGIPSGGLDIMQIAAPEVMCLPDEQPDHLSRLPDLKNYSAIGIGPGIGLHKDTVQLLNGIIKTAGVPLVIDADALNILSENKTWLSFLPGNSILTPHPGEFKRLAGEWKTEEERLKKQQDFAVKSGVIVVVKGAHTCIALPSGQLFFNITGNNGMATAGSGDVLTGIITGLLASGYSPAHAAILGVYLHGLSGDIALDYQSRETLIASDLICHLGKAFKALRA